MKRPDGGVRPASPRVLELVRRCELTLEFAGRARRPAEPLVHGDADAIACDLYVQAVVWALSAHQAARSDPADAAHGPGELAALWAAVGPEPLLGAAGSARALERISADILGKSFVDFAELAPRERLDLAERLATFAEELVSPLRSERKRAERVRARRLFWLAGAVVALAFGALAVRDLLVWNEDRRDLAKNARWTTSSLYAPGSCTSPAQVCADGINYFFHTGQEANPSIVFDLGGRKGISRLVVANRLDCCPERALPLIVEVSNDNKSWKEIARRTEEFTTWRATFPRVRARYVRMHVQGSLAILHLSRVKILP